MPTAAQPGRQLPARHSFPTQEADGTSGPRLSRQALSPAGIS